MEYNISGNGFSMLEIDLEPGEAIIAAEASLVSVEADVHYQRKYVGGLFKKWWARLCLKQPIATLSFRNNTESTRHMMLTHPFPGEVRSIELDNQEIQVDPQALIARFGAVKLRLRWAGVGAMLSKRKPFSLTVRGTGLIWIGAYGGLLEKEIDGEYTLDSHHLIAHDIGVSMHHAPAGGIVRGWLRGEGFATRAVGYGKIILQTKSVNGLGNRLNNHC